MRATLFVIDEEVVEIDAEALRSSRRREEIGDFVICKKNTT